MTVVSMVRTEKVEPGHYRIRVGRESFVLISNSERKGPREWLLFYEPEGDEPRLIDSVRNIGAGELSAQRFAAEAASARADRNLDQSDFTLMEREHNEHDRRWNLALAHLANAYGFALDAEKSVLQAVLELGWNENHMTEAESKYAQFCNGRAESIKRAGRSLRNLMKEIAEEMGENAVIRMNELLDEEEEDRNG